MREIAFLAALLAAAPIPAAAEPVNSNSEENTVIINMQTSEGEIVLELYPEKAEQTVSNFVGYARDGFYDGTIFHRVIPGFMIQGGGFEPGMQAKEAREPIRNEADNGLINSKGTIAMARTSDPHSASSQFFINVANNKFLDHSAKNAQGWGYCVFGKVIEGMEVVETIAGTTTGSVGRFEDVPREDVVIEKVTVQ